LLLLVLRPLLILILLGLLVLILLALLLLFLLFLFLLSFFLELVAQLAEFLRDQLVAELRVGVRGVGRHRAQISGESLLPRRDRFLRLRRLECCALAIQGIAPVVCGARLPFRVAAGHDGRELLCGFLELAVAIQRARRG
jgi:hypothetical protein